MWLGLALFAVSTAVAQERPDFSGRWTVAPPPVPAGGGRGGPQRGDMGSGWGTTITFTQTPTTLTLEWPYYTRGDLQPPLVFVYPLDGSAKTNTLMLGRGLEKQESRTSWDGNKLVIVTTQDFPNLVPGQVVNTRVTRTLTLESPTSLVVETTRSGVLGGKESSTKTVYTKG
jgi:hypothetical protein